MTHVHVPEGVERQEEGPNRNTDDVDDHPSDHLELAVQQEDDGLQTIDGGQHDQRRRRNRLVGR